MQMLNKKMLMNFRLNKKQTAYICTGGIDADYCGEVIIPQFYNGLPVTEIGGEAFSKCNLTSVVIPPSIMRIGASAFSYCKNLQKVTFVDPENSMLNSVEHLAFSGCDALKEIWFPKRLEVIESLAFSHIKIKITIPERCLLRVFAVDSGEVVTYELPPLPPIEKDAIGQSFRLNEEGNGYVYVKSAEADENHEIHVPSEFNGLPVVEIGRMAFAPKNTELWWVYIPKTVTKAQYFPLYANDELSGVVYKGTIQEWLDMDIYSWVPVSCSDGTVQP